MDEPTSGLDPVARNEIHSYIADLRASERTVLFSTHYIEEAEKLCDRVVLLRAGEIVADGSPSELVSRNTSATVNIVLRGAFDADPLLRAGAVFEGRDGDYHRFAAPEPKAAVLALAELLRQPGVDLVDMDMKRPSLEDFYLGLMGEAQSKGYGGPATTEASGRKEEA